MSDGIPQRFPQQSQSSSLLLPSPGRYFGFGGRATPKQEAGERRPSPRSSGGTPICETCQQSVDPLLYNICRGCNQYAHRECHETLSIGMTWRTEMCVLCGLRETFDPYSEGH